MDSLEKTDKLLQKLREIQFRQPSSNADEFWPIDGLADLGKYTSKAILAVVG